VIAAGVSAGTDVLHCVSLWH